MLPELQDHVIMAIPVWLPYAFMAASALANNQAKKKVEKARGNQYDRALKRNKETEEQAKASAAATKSLYETKSQDMVNTGNDLGEMFKESQDFAADAPANPNATAVSVPGGEGQVIGGSGYEDRRKQGSKRYTSQLADALGQVRGVDQELTTTGLEAGINNNDIRARMADMRGSNRVLEAGLLSANEAGKDWGTVADLSSLAAMVSGVGAMAGGAGVEAGAAANAGVTGGSSAVANPLVAGGAVPQMSAALSPAQSLTQMGANSMPWWAKAGWAADPGPAAKASWMQKLGSVFK